MQPNLKIIIKSLCWMLAASSAAVLAEQDSSTSRAHSPVFLSQPADAAPLLLTGQVSSVMSQAIMVPKAGNMWRYQIQWMLPEGAIAEPGQVVVIFDKSTVANRIEQLEAGLLSVTAQEQSQASELDAQLLQSEFDLKEARLELEKAELDAGIPAEFISAKDYANNQFELLKAKSETAKKHQALKEATDNRSATIAQLVIDKKRAQLELIQALEGLKQLEIHAENSGPIIHARHPWRNKKFAVGDSVQVGRQVAAIPAMNQREVIAWVNEVDVDKLPIKTPVDVRLDSQGNATLKGFVEAIGRQAAKKTAWGDGNWFRVKIQFTNDEKIKIIPGMSVLVQPVEKKS